MNSHHWAITAPAWYLVDQVPAWLRKMMGPVYGSIHINVTCLKLLNKERNPLRMIDYPKWVPSTRTKEMTPTVSCNELGNYLLFAYRNDVAFIRLHVNIPICAVNRE